MSYDLAVWYPDRLLSAEQALTQYDELCDENISGLKLHPSIDAFYKELSNIHPEIDDVPEDKLDDVIFSPWSVAHDRSDRHIIMCCVWSRADYVHEFVLNLANKHGLAVFDPQLTKIHYPKDRSR
jgi:hypothetical protein